MSKLSINFKIRKPYLSMWQRSSNVRYVIVMGGRGGGRSTAASQFAASRLYSDIYTRGAFMRAVHSDIRSSAFQELIDRIDEQGATESTDIKMERMVFTYGQNSLKAHGFKTSSSSNTAKLKSLASYNLIWIEEAEEVDEDDFMTLDDSLRTIKGDIVVILSLNPPHKNHWIIQRWFDLDPAEDAPGFFIPKLKEGIDDVLYIRTNYLDNLPNLDEATIRRYENYKTTNPDYYYHKIKGYSPESARGLIYSGWQQIDEIPHEARLVRVGLDFGWFPDEAAAVAIYYYNGGYIIDEIAYGNYISNLKMAEMIKMYLPEVTSVSADGAEPKSISEMRGYGLDIFGIDKGKDSVDFGIKTVASQKISVTKRSVNVWKSYENYAWAEDKDGNPKGEPAHKYSHAMDAIRYGIVSIVGTVDPNQQEQDRKNNFLHEHKRMQFTRKRYNV